MVWPTASKASVSQEQNNERSEFENGTAIANLESANHEFEEHGMPFTFSWRRLMQHVGPGFLMCKLWYGTHQMQETLERKHHQVQSGSSSV
jgi:hypothetical protein